MANPGASWLVGASLRCYPAEWRRRHGSEAADLAALLIHDGTPAGSIACSYLVGAARERLVPCPGRRFGAVAYALIAVCLLSISAALLAPTAPARAASTSHAHARAHCRPGAAEPLRGAIVPAGRPEALIPQPGHGRSC